jgi:hypothetical protein
VADFKLVGSVAIKVRPDTTDFKEQTQKGVKKELAGFDADVQVDAKVKLDSTQAKSEAKKLEKDLDGESITWKVKIDHDSVRAAQKQFERMLEPTQTITFDLDDQGSIDAARAELAQMAKDAHVKITYVQDEKGYQSVLDRIAALRREKLEKTITPSMDEAEWDAIEQEMHEKLAGFVTPPIAQTVHIEIREDRASLEAALATVNAELAKLDTAHFDIEVDREKLLQARHAMEDALSNTPLIFKFTPDEEGYRSVLAKIKAIQRQRVEIPIDLNLSDGALQAQVEEIEEKLREHTTEIPAKVRVRYDLNRAALESSIATIEAELAKIGALEMDVELDRQKLQAAGNYLRGQLTLTPLIVKYTQDAEGYKSVLAKIKAIQRERIEIPIDLNLPDEELAARAAEIQAKLDATTDPVKKISLSYTNDRASLEKVIAELKAQEDKISSIKFDVELDPAKLAAKRAEMEAILAGTPVRVKINYDNTDSIKAARARLQEMLNEVNSATIEVKVDKESLEAELAALDARIKAAEEKAKLNLQVGIKPADILKAATSIAVLTKDQTIKIHMRLADSTLLLAAAKLTGLRAAARWTEAFGRALGKLDRNLPIVAAIVVGISTLTSGVLSLTANVFSLGNGLGEVLRMAGLVAPALLLGVGAVMTVFTGVFKDFGAAVNGDEKAIKKLSESGKKAAAEIRTVFQAIRETISANFWDKAGDSMLRFSQIALPAVGDGLGKLSTSLGGVFSAVLDSIVKLTEQGGTKVFFDNLTKGFDVAQTGMASFMSGFLTLGIVGSTIFPRLGRAFEAWATRFDSWVQRLAADGTLSRWIEKGIQGMKDLFNAGGSLVRAWGNIGQAAQAAGALTLHSFAQMMAKLDAVTAGDRFQKNMQNIFAGARQASISFHDALGDLGPAMDVFSVTIKNSLSGAGTALGSFIALLGDLFSSPMLDKGMTAFLTGITSMFQSLRPAAGAIATILQTFGQILGAVATDSGPLFRNLFMQLSTVLTTAWHALEPFLPGLIQLGTTVVNVLGPALGAVAGAIIPAFASGVQKIGDGLIPVIQLLAQFAVGAAVLISAMPPAAVLGIATAMLTLGGALRLAAITAPLAAAAMTSFGTAAAVAGVRAQLMVPVIGVVLAALSGLIAFGIGSLATAQKSATPFANEYADALNADAKAADGLSDAVGKATRELTAKKLVDSGAVDAAKKLGVSTQELMDAVINGGPALDKLNKRISEASLVYAENDREARNAALGMGEFSSALGGPQGATLSMAEAKDAAELLKGGIEDTRGSFLAGEEQTRKYAEANKAAGIEATEHAKAQKSLIERVRESNQQLGAAAAASTVLQDASASSASKIDAMRKTFELLVGPNAKLQADEALGAYASGFNNLRDMVTPLAGDMKKLGDAVYGENGFLNVKGGNKAVMQVNQALVDQVNNTWAGSKAIYDEAIKAGDNATTAYQKAKKFVDDHKGDYDALATASGVSAKQVQGQWDAVFGKEWVLKVALSGATEAAAIAQAMVTTLGGIFDGQKFTAIMDADPTLALLAIKDPVAAAEYFVNKEWVAQLDALPDKAAAAVQKQIGMTDEQWAKGNFEAVLKVAAGVPGLAQALQDIRNGVNLPYWATIFAQLNNASVRAVQIALNSLTMTRSVAIRVAYDYTNAGDPMARAGQRVIGSANGNILNGRGIKKFANGGIERHVAQITKPGGPIRVWSEPETHGEAYVPYAMSKRPRSVAILSRVAKDFGYSLNKATNSYANGGTVGTAVPTRTSNTSVTVGVLNTVDPDAAVKKLRELQQDALAVSGIN